jgi:nucleoid DNA-binding protein
MNRKALVAAIVQQTGVTPAEARRALGTVLDSIKRALSEGRRVDLGKLGILSVRARPLKHRANRNLRHVGPNIDRLHKKHPKTVRLTERQDLSIDPQPTVVTKSDEEGRLPAARMKTPRVAVAFPSWRRRPA